MPGILLLLPCILSARYPQLLLRFYLLYPCPSFYSTTHMLDYILYILNKIPSLYGFNNTHYTIVNRRLRINYNDDQKLTRNDKDSERALLDL